MSIICLHCTLLFLFNETDHVHSEVEYSLDWGLLLGLISFLAFINEMLRKRFARSRKGLEICYINTIQMPYKLTVYIANSGTETLNSIDYHIVPKITFDSFLDELRFVVSTSNEFTQSKTTVMRNVSPTTSSTDLIFDINQFEPKNYLKVEVECKVSSKIPYPVFSYRFKEEKHISMNLDDLKTALVIGGLQDQNIFMFIPFTSAAIALLLTHFMLTYVLKIDFSNTHQLSTGLRILVYIPAIIFAINRTIAWHKRLDMRYNGHRKIKKWIEKDWKLPFPSGM